MNPRESNFSTEDYNYINSNEIMDSVSSNVTIVSTELNDDTDSFADIILNFHRIENYTNNTIYNEQLSLEEFDKVLHNIEIQNDGNNDNLNYNILDLDNLEYITYKSNKNTAVNYSSDTSCDIQYFLYEHNYYIRKEATPTCEDPLDTSKLRDSNKTVENMFSNISYFKGTDIDELNESPPHYRSGYNLQESDIEPVDFVTISNNISTATDNISIYTISDDEQRNDDVISISSASSIEDIFDITNNSDSNSCGYHSSDFEFIDEHEAKKNGLMINYKPQIIKEDKVKTIEIAKEYNSEQLILDYFNIPAVTIEYKIPQDMNYISMFERNIPYPVHCMENKSVNTNNCSINAKDQALGFNTNLYRREKVDKHVQDEADESENKILFLYPSENRRMRKRRRT